MFAISKFCLERVIFRNKIYVNALNASLGASWSTVKAANVVDVEDILRLMVDRICQTVDFNKSAYHLRSSVSSHAQKRRCMELTATLATEIIHGITVGWDQIANNETADCSEEAPQELARDLLTQDNYFLTPQGSTQIGKFYGGSMHEEDREKYYECVRQMIMDFQIS